MGKKKRNINKKKRQKQLLKAFDSTGNSIVTYICLQCGIAEGIPKDIIEMIEILDEDFSPYTAPQFSCEKCGGEMYPQYYKNFCGMEFQLTDVQNK